MNEETVEVRVTVDMPITYYVDVEPGKDDRPHDIVNVGRSSNPIPPSPQEMYEKLGRRGLEELDQKVEEALEENND